MRYARVSITLPEDLLVSLDQRAEELDRPRSWAVAEAVRQWLESGRQPAGTAVREPAPVVNGAADVAEARQGRLVAELKLTPAERVRRAEGLGRLARAHQRRGPRAQIIGFDSYEDYYEWKKARRAGV